MCLSILWRFMENEEGVTRRGRRVETLRLKEPGTSFFQFCKVVFIITYFCLENGDICQSVAEITYG